MQSICQFDENHSQVFSRSQEHFAQIFRLSLRSCLSGSSSTGELVQFRNSINKLNYRQAKFGLPVVKLVDGVTKLNKLASRARAGEARSKAQAENLRKMLLATAEDLRVVLIKLADRLHNMRTLGVLPAEKRRAIAQETLEIYAPLAHRLGMREAKWQLEDLAFRYLKPRVYHQIARLVAGKRTEREGFISEASQMLSQELDKVGIKAKVYGRRKE